EMWPPQAITMDWLALRAVGMLNVTDTVEEHWPVPDGTLSLVIVAGPMVEPDAPNRSMVPGCWVPEKVPPAPPQPCSPPGRKLSAGAGVVAAGAAGLVCWPELLYALPH